MHGIENFGAPQWIHILRNIVQNLRTKTLELYLIMLFPIVSIPLSLSIPPRPTTLSLSPVNVDIKKCIYGDFDETFQIFFGAVMSTFISCRFRLNFFQMASKTFKFESDFSLADSVSKKLESYGSRHAIKVFHKKHLHVV